MDDIPVPLTDSKIRLTEQLRHLMRLKHLSYSTEKTYIYWIINFIRFHNRRHPNKMGSIEVDSYLSYLAVKRKVSPNTQSLALNALIFLYQKFLGKELGKLNFTRPRKKIKPPVVLTHDEAMNIIAHIENDVYKLMAKIMHGSGLRLMECCRLRVKDINFGMNEIMIDLRTIQELLGHSDIRTTEIYTHVLNKGGRGVNSPID